MQKRGLSDVVATVIIVALVIVAITVVWLGVMPLIRDKIGGSDMCNDMDVSIENSQGYTCYKPNNITVVQINKGSNDVNISELKFFLSSAGNSVSFVKNVSFGRNSYYSFYLNTSKITKLEKVEVVPVVKAGNAKKECASVFIENVGVCGSAGFSASEIAQLINESNTNTNSPSVPSPDSAYPQFSIYSDNSGGSTVGTGGAITSILVGGQNYTVHSFTTVGSSSFTLPIGVTSVDYLIVAGGGGGGKASGASYSGGGGAGGLIYGNNQSVTATEYTIVVGGGGAGKITSGTGDNGINSSFGAITATGGGGGGGSTYAPNTGGSGGGTKQGNGGIGAAGIPGQGNKGGDNGAGGGGGGGGAGDAGQIGVTEGGAGGIGLAYDLSGESLFYAGGGGGMGSSKSSSGGSGVGGNGGPTPGNGMNGRGGGGGGGGATTSGSGGSGIVIIRYLTPSFRGLFNVTLANTNGTVLLNINNQNITATNLTANVYNVSYSLSPGSYSYKWYSWGNGTSHLMNVSNTRTFTVN